jgi:hypothetical protein
MPGITKSCKGAVQHWLDDGNCEVESVEDTWLVVLDDDVTVKDDEDAVDDGMIILVIVVGNFELTTGWLNLTTGDVTTLEEADADADADADAVLYAGDE